MTLFTYKKIPLEITLSWFIFVGIMSAMFAFKSESLGEGVLSFTIAFLAFAFLFSFVVLHEFGHSLAAQYFGYKVNKIQLIPFGGAAMIEGGFSAVPKHEFWITFWGPIVNLVIVAVLWPIIALLPAPVESIEGVEAVGAIAYHMFHLFLTFSMKINLTLFLFNLLPFYPMDGGRFLKASLGFFLPVKKAANYAFGLSCFVGIPVAIWAIFNNYFVGWFFPMLLLMGYAELKSSFGEAKTSVFKTIMLDNRNKNKKIRDKFYDSKQASAETINAYKEFDNLIDTMCLSIIDLTDKIDYATFNRKMNIYFESERQLFLIIKDLPAEKWNENEINIRQIVEDVRKQKEEV